MPFRPLQALVPTAPSKPCKGNGYRSIDVIHHGQPLSVEGSRRKSGRFHVAGQAAAIYIALDPVTALLETGALLRTDQRMTPQVVAPRTMFTIVFDLKYVMDLTDPATREHLGYGLDMLRSPWRRRTPNAPTQLLGRAAYEEGVQGLIYPSAKNPDGTNLVVFPDNLTIGQPGRLRVFDPNGNLDHTLP